MTSIHTRGLCHTPDREIPLGARVEHFESNPVHCKCCGTKLIVKDYHGSLSFEQLGLLVGICPVCPSNEGQ
jgi:hypothetical protein